MKRRDFLKIAAVSCGALAIPGVASARKKRWTNVVLMMADDFAFECLQCNGGTSYETPVLDDLAKKGLRFTNCHSNPVCTPTRVKIMTGKHNYRNYVHFGTLDHRQKTFGHIMQAGGYKTCIAGKWQLTGFDAVKGTRPEDAGFDDYCLYHVDDPADSRYWNPRLIQNGKWLEGMEGKYGPDVFRDFVMDFMADNKDRPFFAYYPMALTHGPHIPTPDTPDREPSPNGKYQRDGKYMKDMVAYTDKIVGQMVDKLEELGIAENTLLLFTGDNGNDKKITSYMGDLAIRGGKGQSIEWGTHVPFIAYWKGTTPVGGVCEDLIDFSDMLPTIADAGRVKIPGDFITDGISFLPQLKGKQGNAKEWLYFHYEKGKGVVTPESRTDKGEPTRWVRDKKWKLYNNGNLFHAMDDPFEKNAISTDTSETKAIRKKFQAILDKYPKVRQLDPELRDLPAEKFYEMKKAKEENEARKKLKNAGKDKSKSKAAKKAEKAAKKAAEKAESI
ncbi:MAG: sulfatase-like hydrolase/transferase [Phycisphaerae bacterium]|nr:sulfatase-like hydrolase/transferase [Phycisphaerae bacterium]